LTLVAIIVAGGYALAAPVKNWFANAPQYFSTAQEKLSRLRQPVQKVVEVANQARGAMDGSTTAPSSAPTSNPTTSTIAANKESAVPVAQTIAPASPPTFTMHSVLGTTTQVIGGLVEVLLLLFLLLASGSLFVEKLVALLPQRMDKQVAKTSVHESEHAVLRYMFVTALIN